jgi:hypothetical protein
MDEDARLRHFELLATIVLAVAAVATAWSTYQGARWRGEQAVETSRATAARIESSEAATRAGQLTEIDIATFTQWVDATVGGDPALAEFYEHRFREEFQPAFQAWLATDPLTNAEAPLTPFAMPEYELAETRRAERLNDTATARTALAGAANEHADHYLLALVLFAAALFFAGVSGKLRPRRQREILLGIGVVFLIGAAIWVATQPVSITR